MIDIDDDPATARHRTVHHRFHVYGLFGAETCGSGELADTAQSFDDAVRIARRWLCPRGFERVQVFDSMARRGRPKLWDVTADAVTCAALKLARDGAE